MFRHPFAAILPVVLFAVVLAFARSAMGGERVVAGPVAARVISVVDGDTIRVAAMVWPGHMVMAVAQSPSEALRDRCAELGRELIALPDEPGTNPPSDLANALGVSA